MPTQPDLILDARADLAEGPLWQPREQRLYWVDINAGRLHVFDPASGADACYEVGRMLGAVAFRRGGGLILAAQDGLAEFDLATRQVRIIHDPEPELPNTRFNDGKCDAAGRFWAGTIAMDRQPGAASLYCLDVDRRVRRVLRKLTNSNGLGWSPDHRTMYHIDTPTLRVSAFDFDLPRGTIANRRTIIELPPGAGRPDGMTVDAEGMLWIAHWDGGRVTRWNPVTGALLATVSLPADRVSSCTFGGPRLERLYITTARHGLTPKALAAQPHAGGLFCIEPGVCGLPANEYAG